MRKFILLTLAAMAIAATAALSTPAAAIEAREAIRRCDAAPPCHFTVDRDGGLTVTGASGGIVQCPPKGACSVIQNLTADKHKPGTGGKVTDVLAASPSGTAKPTIRPRNTDGAAPEKKTGSLQNKDPQPSARIGTEGSKKH